MLLRDVMEAGGVRIGVVRIHRFCAYSLATTLRYVFLFWVHCRSRWSTNLRQTQSTIRTKTRIVSGGGYHWLSNYCAVHRPRKMDEARFIISLLRWMGKRHKRTRSRTVTPIPGISTPLSVQCNLLLLCCYVVICICCLMSR